MKHRLLFLTIILILSFIACSSQEKNKTEELNEIDSLISCDLITLKIINNSLSTQGCTISVTNNDKNNITFGSQFCLQLKNENKWCSIQNEQSDWTGELIMLNPSQTATINIDWSKTYGELQSGTYRIIKQFQNNDSTFFCSATFSI